MNNPVHSAAPHALAEVASGYPRDTPADTSIRAGYEVPADFPRQWFEFQDPAQSDHLIRCDLTWLLSGYGCRFGTSDCFGILADEAWAGCCQHGAYLCDEDDLQRLRRTVAELPARFWERRPADTDSWLAQFGPQLGESDDEETDDVLDGHEDENEDEEEGSDFSVSPDDDDPLEPWLVWDELDNDEGEPEPALKTPVVDGACIFANKPGWPTGAGCALHQWAMETDQSHVKTKPDVCWQLPIRREAEWTTRTDGNDLLVTSITEYDRRGWGDGGEDFDWYCTGAANCHQPHPDAWADDPHAPQPDPSVPSQAVWATHRDELVELLGEPAYEVLAQHCAELEWAQAQLRARVSPGSQATSQAPSPANANSASAPKGTRQLAIYPVHPATVRANQQVQR